MHLIGCKLMQNRHRHSPIGERSQEGHRPTGTISPGKSHLVAPFHAAMFEKNVQLFNLAGHIMVLQRLSFKVGQCIQVPIVLNTFLDVCVKTRYIFHFIGVLEMLV